MTTVEKIIRKHLTKAKKEYDRHLADKHSLSGPYLVGKYNALFELNKELESHNVKAKAKKTGR